MNKIEYIAKLEEGKKIALELATDWTSELRTAIDLWQRGQRCADAIRDMCIQLCKDCSCTCCYSYNGYWRIEHWILYLLAEGEWTIKDEPLPIPPCKDKNVKQSVRRVCQFLDSKGGCVLPRFGRPTTCASYTCHRWRDFLDDMGCDNWYRASQTLVCKALREAEHIIQPMLEGRGCDWSDEWEYVTGPNCNACSTRKCDWLYIGKR